MRFIVGLVVCGLLSLQIVASTVLHWDELQFGWRGDQPTDAGDVDRLLRSGANPASGFAHNTFVRYEHGVVVEARSGGPGISYFFDPVLNLVGITQRTLPARGTSQSSPVHSAYGPLIAAGWLAPADVSASFSGQGWLLRADEAPSPTRAVGDFYRSALRLDERRPDVPLWIFLDGHTPGMHRDSAFVLGAVTLALMLSCWFTWRARRGMVAVDDLLET